MGEAVAELLADLLTDGLESLAAGAVRGTQLVVAINAGQTCRQRLAQRLDLGAAPEGLAALMAAISSSPVSATMASNSTVCVLLSMLSAEEPKRQRLSCATWWFSASILI